MTREYVVRVRQVRDRDEIGHLVGKVRAHGRVDRHLECGGIEGVAVRLRLRRQHRADRAAGARPVLDDKAVGNVLVQLLDQHARHRVHAAARRERHDETDRMVGPALGARRNRHDAGCKQRHSTRNSSSRYHVFLLAIVGRANPVGTL